ncbi:MAG: hypothetical protein PVI22_14010 [Lysobacterales bacterium]
MKKVVFGAVWFLVLLLGTSMVVGAVAGAIAGANDPANASQAGFVAGQAIVAKNRLYIAIVALVVAVVGTIKEKLPGTKTHA